MKIITILSLCLTASLSFVHSQILDKTNDDVFTYDYSGMCTDIPNCYPSMKNLPEIDDNSRFPPMPLRVGESIAVYSPSWSNFNFVVAGVDEVNNDADTPNYQPISKNLPKILKKSSISKRIKTTATIHNASQDTLNFISIGIDDKPIWISHGEIDDDSYQRYFALGFGFPSEASANAYFNIHILNNTPNNQLGYLHWISTIFYSGNSDHEMNINLFRSHHITSFDTTIIESFTNPVQPNMNMHFPKQSQIIFDEISNFNTIFLWTEEDIRQLQFGRVSHAEQHQLSIHPLANQTTTSIDTVYIKDAENVLVRLDHSPSTWIIENNTNSNITVHLCADDSRKIEENRVYGLGTPNGCIRTPIELVTYSNKLHPKCTIQLTPFSSQIFDSSIFIKNKQNHLINIRHDF